MGTGEPSVAEYIAECQRILQKSGLQFKVCDNRYYRSTYSDPPQDAVGCLVLQQLITANIA